MIAIRQLATVVRHVLGESLRRRIFHVALVIAIIYVALFWLGLHVVFRNIDARMGTQPGDLSSVDNGTLAASSLLGLAMFGLQFLGAVLAIFLTLGTVRGEAERGLLQQLVVRPISRSTLLYGRLVGAALLGTTYVLMLFAACTAVTWSVSGWTPDHPVAAALQLAACPIVVGSLSVLGSCLFSAMTNGIAQFMLLGTALVAGLLGQVGESLRSPTLQSVGEKVALALPFEALYQNALHVITSETVGITRIVINLGPFGGAHEYGAGLYVWVLVYVAGAIGLATWLFARSDL